jgi:hypothetical protein
MAEAGDNFKFTTILNESIFKIYRLIALVLKLAIIYGRW